MCLAWVHAQEGVPVPDHRAEGIPLGVHRELASRFFRGIWAGVVADLGGPGALRPGTTHVLVAGSSVRGWSFKRRDPFELGASDIDFAIRSDELVERGLAELRGRPEVLDALLAEKEFARFRAEPEPRQALLTYLAREGQLPHTRTGEIFPGIGGFMAAAGDPGTVEGKAVTWGEGRERVTVKVSVMVHSRASFDRSYQAQLDQWRRAKGRELPGTPGGQQCIDVPPPETMGTVQRGAIGHEAYVPPEKRGPVRVAAAAPPGPMGAGNPRPEGLLGMGEPENPRPPGPVLVENPVDAATIERIFFEEAVELAKDPRYEEQVERLLAEGEQLTRQAREAGGTLPERIVLEKLRASEIPALRFDSLPRIRERMARERGETVRPIEQKPAAKFVPKAGRG